MSDRQYTRRLLRVVTSAPFLVSGYARVVVVWISRALAYGLALSRRKLVLVAFCVGAGGLALRGYPGWAVVVLAPAALTAAAVLHERLMRRLQLWRIASDAHSHAGFPPARDTLLELGIDTAVVDRILSTLPDDGEALIAEFDQQNRVLSHVGPIAAFREISVGADQFVKRARHLVQFVVLRDTLVIRKTYRDFTRFANEVLALRALADVAGVPKIVAVRPSKRVLCQTFLPGTNVGSAMAAAGFSVSHQYQTSQAYPGSGNWSDQGGSPSQRLGALNAVRKLVDPACLRSLGELLVSVHRAGVAIRDVKYGNVMISEGKASLCDFDGSHVFSRNEWRFIQERERDRDKFNYLFGGALLTEPTMRAQLDELFRERADLRSRVPAGSTSRLAPVRPSLLAAEPEARIFLRTVIPELRGKRVVHLGSENVLLPLEMLKRGAAAVTTFEADSAAARLARLNHTWLEFVDNRKYEFEIVEKRGSALVPGDFHGFDVATAFWDRGFEAPEEADRIIQMLGRAVRVFLVRCDRNRDGCRTERVDGWSLSSLRALLTRGGFPNQHVVGCPSYDQPLIIARVA